MAQERGQITPLTRASDPLRSGPLNSATCSAQPKTIFVDFIDIKIYSGKTDASVLQIGVIHAAEYVVGLWFMACSCAVGWAGRAGRLLGQLLPVFSKMNSIEDANG